MDLGGIRSVIRLNYHERNQRALLKTDVGLNNSERVGWRNTVSIDIELVLYKHGIPDVGSDPHTRIDLIDSRRVLLMEVVMG